jgi:hypothetical protein
MKHTIKIPADAETVTLELKKQCMITLRALLPQVKNEVELVIVDEFGCRPMSDADLYRLKANDGVSLLHKLTRSRVVEGEALLDLTPGVTFVEPQMTLLNGTLSTRTGTGYIQLTVKPPVPGEEG